MRAYPNRHASRFHIQKSFSLTDNSAPAPDATSEIIVPYAFTDEQALLAKNSLPY